MSDEHTDTRPMSDQQHQEGSDTGIDRGYVEKSNTAKPRPIRTAAGDVRVGKQFSQSRVPLLQLNVEHCEYREDTDDSSRSFDLNGVDPDSCFRASRSSSRSSSGSSSGSSSDGEEHRGGEGGRFGVAVGIGPRGFPPYLPANEAKAAARARAQAERDSDAAAATAAATAAETTEGGPIAYQNVEGGRWARTAEGIYWVSPSSGYANPHLEHHVMNARNLMVDRASTAAAAVAGQTGSRGALEAAARERRRRDGAGGGSAIDEWAVLPRRDREREWAAGTAAALAAAPAAPMSTVRGGLSPSARDGGHSRLRSARLVAGGSFTDAVPAGSADRFAKTFATALNVFEVNAPHVAVEDGDLQQRRILKAIETERALKALVIVQAIGQGSHRSRSQTTSLVQSREIAAVATQKVPRYTLNERQRRPREGQDHWGSTSRANCAHQIGEIGAAMTIEGRVGKLAPPVSKEHELTLARDATPAPTNHMVEARDATPAPTNHMVEVATTAMARGASTNEIIRVTVAAALHPFSENATEGTAALSTSAPSSIPHAFKSDPYPTAHTVVVGAREEANAGIDASANHIALLAYTDYSVEGEPTGEDLSVPNLGRNRGGRLQYEERGGQVTAEEGAVSGNSRWGREHNRGGAEETGGRGRSMGAGAETEVARVHYRQTVRGGEREGDGGDLESPTKSRGPVVIDRVQSSRLRSAGEVNFDS